ncbi:MAG: CpsD/CapB family tyrosine-protein kinase [Candidatus Omnitrophota bacterium]|jgi:capsular exopolysaccharide synthesis family protein|nr:CpsD/CapB family tyrosine-protein kinase [Candidatus Omnitrophota bacterium]
MKFPDFSKLKEILDTYSAPIYVIKTLRNEKGVDGRLVSYMEKNCHLAEQYKVLRTNLYSLSSEKPIKTIVVTSTQASEGKTVTSCNMAYALSLDTEKKTLLMDADFRRPSTHTIFGLQRKPGFADVLSGEADIESLIEKPALDNLFVVPAGTIKVNPSEILSSTRMKVLIDKLRARFDYIIFDTPPVLNVTDATILGSFCDAVLFVVRAGVTQKAMIEEAFNMLAGAQAKPRACILTGAYVQTYQYYSKYRYYYQHPYGK